MVVEGPDISDALRTTCWNDTRPTTPQTVADLLTVLSDIDEYNCSACNACIGGTLWGDADEYSLWTTMIVMDRNAETLYCERCYAEIVEELS